MGLTGELLYTQQRKPPRESDTGTYYVCIGSGLRRKKNASRQIEEPNSFHRIRCSQSKPYTALFTFRNRSALYSAIKSELHQDFEHQQTSHKTPLFSSKEFQMASGESCRKKEEEEEEKKKEEEEKKKVEDLLSPRHPHPCVVAARGRFFSRVGRKIEA
ncbi:hypothetical protein BHE74_00009199, partial [Ensete ventricosum]